MGEPMVERVMAQYAARVEVAHSEAHRPSGRCVVGITPRDGSHIHDLPGAGEDASFATPNNGRMSVFEGGGVAGCDAAYRVCLE